MAAGDYLRSIGWNAGKGAVLFWRKSAKTFPLDPEVELRTLGEIEFVRGVLEEVCWGWVDRRVYRKRASEHTTRFIVEILEGGAKSFGWISLGARLVQSLSRKSSNRRVTVRYVRQTRRSPGFGITVVE